MVRSRFVCMLAAIFCVAAPTNAGLWQDVYRGFQATATPIGGQGGERFGRLRIVPNTLGDGYRLEFDRNFGTDTFGRPEVYDLGNMELELRGRIATTAQFTSRGLVTGTADVLANNLVYSLRGKTGLQDFELAGTLSMDNAVEVNQLGFYTMTVDVTNANSELTVDGNLVTGIEDTAFDIGPVNVRGNVFVDIGIALLGSFGVDTTALEQMFPGSPIDRVVDEIQSTLQTQATAFTAKDLTLSEFGPTQILPTSAQSVAVAGTQYEWSPASADPFVDGSSTVIPEPTALALLAIGALLLTRRRA